MARNATLLPAALAALHAGQPDEAGRLYRRLLRAAPEDFDALHGLGILQLQAGQHASAVSFFERALRTGPRGRATSQLHNNHALALTALGRPDAALDSLDRALALAPADATLHHNRGNALMALRRDEAARACFEHAVALSPGLLPAWQNLAVVQTRLGLHHAALATCDHLIALAPGANPDLARVRQARGEALLALHRPAEAIDDLAAAAAAPGDDHAGERAHLNHAHALHAAGRSAEAVDAVNAALGANPEFALAHWNAASICLSLGDYARGWREYEWRWLDPSFRGRRRDFAQKLWPGDAPLAGRTILLHAEQGFGDTIQFCRYVPMVAALGGRVLLEAPAPLLPLLRSLAGVDQLISCGEALPAFDTHCPLMSLPLAFGTTLETIPAPRSYLAADPAAVARWAARLGPAAGPRVGLAWSGSAAFIGDATRSAPLAALAPLIRPGASYVSLQKEVRPADAAAAERLGVQRLDDAIAHFGDTAALASLMDLVISVDSAPAHLAGALGRPTWLLLHQPAEWRWMRDRSDSPWYPTARLFRQHSAGDWAEVCTRAAAGLDALFAAAG